LDAEGGSSVTALRRELAQLEAVARAEIRALPADGSFQQITDDHPWMSSINAPDKAWRSRNFVVQLYDREGEGAPRLSIQRTMANQCIRPANKDLRPISWDELMAVKSVVGYGDHWAVELYPSNDQVVDDCPMRHLWLLPGEPPIGWRVRR
jgi:hypothetical protein